MRAWLTPALPDGRCVGKTEKGVCGREGNLSHQSSGMTRTCMLDSVTRVINHSLHRRHAFFAAAALAPPPGARCVATWQPSPRHVLTFCATKLREPHLSHTRAAPRAP